MRYQAVSRTLFATVMMLASLSIAGCGGGKSPTEVVKSFYMAANDGKYSDAKTMLAKDAQNLVDGPLGQLAGGWKGLCDKNTKSGSITSITPISEEIRGEGATVVVTIHFKDGSSKSNDKNGLIREGGLWRLTLGH